jgi:16S rRNA (guanine(966)-N(2))-methyltransferase RsmD
MTPNRAGTLRIIGGTLRGRRLLAPGGRTTRPPLDSQRETIFNVLGPVFEGAVVADLFAGSGSFGLEALSRGAAAAWFVERDLEALRALRGNLDRLGLASASHVFRGDAFAFPSGIDDLPDRVDAVFVDPPFRAAAEGQGPRRLLDLLERIEAMLGPEAIVVVRLPLEAPVPGPVSGAGSEKTQNVRTLGQSRVVFRTYRKEIDST